MLYLSDVVVAVVCSISVCPPVYLSVFTSLTCCPLFIYLLWIVIVVPVPPVLLLLLLLLLLLVVVVVVVRCV